MNGSFLVSSYCVVLFFEIVNACCLAVCVSLQKRSYFVDNNNLGWNLEIRKPKII